MFGLGKVRQVRENLSRKPTAHISFEVPKGFRLASDYAESQQIVCKSCGQRGSDPGNVRHKRTCEHIVVGVRQPTGRFNKTVGVKCKECKAVVGKDGMHKPGCRTGKREKGRPAK